jgi:hypothetical protein
MEIGIVNFEMFKNIAVKRMVKTLEMEIPPSFPSTTISNNKIVSQDYKENKNTYKIIFIKGQTVNDKIFNVRAFFTEYFLSSYSN